MNRLDVQRRIRRGLIDILSFSRHPGQIPATAGEWRAVDRCGTEDAGYVLQPCDRLVQKLTVGVAIRQLRWRDVQIGEHEPLDRYAERLPLQPDGALNQEPCGGDDGDGERDL